MTGLGPAAGMLEGELTADEERKLRELIEIEAIQKLKARYFVLVDARCWDEFRALFTDDAEFGGPAFVSSVDTSSLDRFIESSQRNLGAVLTSHHGHTPLIELTRDSAARGLWPFESYAHNKWRNRRSVYEEEYRKENGRWKISSMMIWLMPTSVPADDREVRTEELRELAQRWLPVP